MANINLGSRSPMVGGGAVQFDPLIYDEKNAYIIYVNMTVGNIANVFSYIRIKPLVTPANEPNFYLAPYVDLEIREELQGFFFAASPLFNGSGTCVLEMERLPFVAGYGDTTIVDIAAFYDNAISVKTWRS